MHFCTSGSNGTQINYVPIKVGSEFVALILVLKVFYVVYCITTRPSESATDPSAPQKILYMQKAPRIRVLVNITPRGGGKKRKEKRKREKPKKGKYAKE